MVEEHGVEDRGTGRVRFGVTHGSLNPGSRAADAAADPDNADSPVAAPDTNLGSIRRDDRACRAGSYSRGLPCPYCPWWGGTWLGVRDACRASGFSLFSRSSV